MKIEFVINKSHIEDETKTLNTEESLIYASPCLIKYQEEWFNEIIKPENSKLVKFYEEDIRIDQNNIFALYVKNLLHVQFSSTGLIFLNWWSELVGLNETQKKQSIETLKRIGINDMRLSLKWNDLGFEHKFFIILAPVSIKYKIVNIFLGDYFIERDDIEIFNNQISPFLSVSKIKLIMFWSLNFRNLKGQKLYFTGFNNEGESEK